MALVVPAWLMAVLAALWACALVLGLRGRIVPVAVRLPLTVVVAGLAVGSYGFHFGRDTGAALLATMLVLKLFELRRIRDARSVLGFGLFAAMAAFLLDQGPAMLLAGIVGCIVILAALAEVADREAGARRRPLRRRLLGAASILLLSLPLA